MRRRTSSLPRIYFTRRRVLVLVYLIMLVLLVRIEMEKNSQLVTNQEEEHSTFKYRRPKEVKHLDCGQFFSNSTEALNKYLRRRIKIKDGLDFYESLLAELYGVPSGFPLINSLSEYDWFTIPMDCASIKQRHYFHAERLDPGEDVFPIAFSRTVYKDYRFLEAELASSYFPENVYCYALDAKAENLFRYRMQRLASCFPNVFVTEREYVMDRFGRNMTESHLECIHKLFLYQWKYLVLLQNHDIALKTNQELVKIFKWFNGTNDIGALHAWPAKNLKNDTSWNVGALNLINNATKEQQEIHLEFAKSFFQVSIPRTTVEYLLTKLNISGILTKINEHGEKIDCKNMTRDELLMGTLNAEDRLNLPGGFTQSCLKKGIEVHSMTRLTYWNLIHDCPSGIERHHLCIFGMENLFEFARVPELFANKFMPDQDFGAISCWFEYLHNQTHLVRNSNRLNSSAYLNMPQVRFNRERSRLGSKFDVDEFDCTS